MSVTIRCGDVVPGCSAEFRDASEDGVLGQVAHHAAEAHPDIVLTPEVIEIVRATVRSN